MSTLKALLKDVPVEWKALGDIVSISNTGVDKKVNTDEKQVRLLNFVDVFKNKYITTETPKMVVTATDKKIADCDVRKFDLFITPSSELIDEIGFSALSIEDLKNTVYSYHIMRLRIIDLNQIYPHYLNYLFASSDVRKQIRQKAQGITRYGLTQPNWKSIKIPIPYPNDPEKSLAIQQEIVRVLDGLSEQNKALTTALAQEIDHRKKQYEYYREELFRFEGKEVELKTLGEVIISLKTGLNPRKNFVLNAENSLGFYVTVREIVNEEIVFGPKTDRVSLDALKLINNRSNLEKGDVLFSGTGTVGRMAVIKEEPHNWNIKEGIYVIKPKSNILISKYLLYVLSTQLIIDSYNKKIVGSPVVSLPMKDLRNLKIPIPSIQEQERIVHLLDQYDEATKNIVAQLEKEIELRNKQYEYYRNQLLGFS